MDGSCICPDCGKHYKSTKTLSVHRKTHTGLRPYTCDTCNKSFARKDVFGEHVKAHDSSKANYVCQECGKVFARRFCLDTHLLHHKPDKKYSCAVCTKTYFTLSNLRQHEETHQEKKKCPKCDTYVIHLKTHAKTCGADVSFSCSTCGKTFRQKRYLTEHLSTHNQTKQYTCPKCRKNFKHRSSLYNHNKSCVTKWDSPKNGCLKILSPHRYSVVFYFTLSKKCSV